MNKNKKITIPFFAIVILIIIVIVGIIIGIIATKKSDGSKLNKIYEQMIRNNTYVFTRYDLEEKNKIITSRKIDKTMIDMYNSGEHISTLILNGDTYLIFHENQEYYTYSNNSKDAEILTDELKEIIQLEYTTGKEKIYGKTYNYEEYKGVSNFLIYSNKDMDVDSIRTRFYFKGKDLVYLKTIYDVVNEDTGERTQSEELQTVNVDFEVKDDVFTIPENYAEK